MILLLRFTASVIAPQIIENELETITKNPSKKTDNFQMKVNKASSQVSFSYEQEDIDLEGIHSKQSYVSLLLATNLFSCLF